MDNGKDMINYYWTFSFFFSNEMRRMKKKVFVLNLDSNNHKMCSKILFKIEG